MTRRRMFGIRRNRNRYEPVVNNTRRFEPNGKREVARRLRQIAAGRLKISVTWIMLEKVAA